MSQKSVEIVVGRLVTDEEFRHQFRRDAGEVVRSLLDQGLDLTRAEVNAILSLDATSFERFAETLDPRLQKASLRALHPDESPRRADEQRLSGEGRP